MNYSINKLSPLIMLGAKQTIVAEGVKERRGRGEESARLYCVCHIKRYCSHTQSNEDHF